MKKLISLITAVSASVTMMTAISSFGAGEDDYCPRLYFKYNRTAPVETLTDGSVYINKNNIPAEGIKISPEVYFDDKQKLAGHIIVKFRCSDNHIKLTDPVDPITLCGSSSYKKFSDKNDFLIKSNADVNSISVTYSLGLNNSAFELNADTTDKYPLVGFTADISEDIPTGKYSIEFMTEEMGNKCNILYIYDDDRSPKDKFPSGKDAMPLNIRISDRNLGDVNDDKRIDTIDASMVLRASTLISSNMESGFTEEQMIAADIDGDGMITTKDASLLLKYSTYLSSNGKLSLSEYYAKK